MYRTTPAYSQVAYLKLIMRELVLAISFKER
ncbi:hypothetical protein [Paraburkholderia oxyphila]